MVKLLVAILTVWRLAHLFIWEDGPFNLFSNIRNWAGVEYTANSEPYGTTFLSTLFSCVYCMSVWIATAYVIAEWVFNPATRKKGLFYKLSTPLALSGGALIVNRYVRG